MTIQFKCQQCGLCCQTKYLCLYPSELERAKLLAQKLDVEFQVEPLRRILEEKSKKIIVLIYRVTERPCPFFADNKCSIHDTKFVACHKYPISQWIDLGKIFGALGFNNEFYDVDEKCTFIKTHSNFKTALNTQPLSAILPDEYQAVHEDKKIWIELNNQFKILKKEQIIKAINESRLKKENPKEYQIILNSWEQISATDFLNNFLNF